jgi:16S rRNA (cytosine967-C5)-methyltransferase
MQRQILNQAATLVQPNGTLIYATCSVLPAENQTIVQQFLDTHEGWRIQPLHERVGDDRAQEIGDGTFLSLTPHEHGTDGFFAAVLVR